MEYDKELVVMAADMRGIEAFKVFLEASIARQAAEKAFKREDTTHIADAKDLIYGAIDELIDTYGPKKRDKEAAANEAR